MARRSISGMVVTDVTGWILISSDGADEWHIALLDVFNTKKGALAFAAKNGWPHPYKAIRGRIMADPMRS